MHDLHAALLALQELDREIAAAEAVVNAFAPQIAALDAPVTAAEREAESMRAKLADMRAEANRLEVNAQQKRERLASYQDRLTRARTTREEAALKAEVDLVRRALEADVADTKQAQEQATRLDLKLDDVDRQVEKARAEAAPRRAELLEQQTAAEDALARLRDQRENQAVRLDPQSRRLYERLRSGKTSMVLAPLTAEGACGNCFNVLPVQEQSVVRRAESLHRCEACGVILYAA